MKTVVLLSGGLDSTTVLAHALYLGHTAHAVIVDYGQRHRRELRSADEIAWHYKVPTSHVAIDPMAFAGADSSQVGQMKSVPHGHYAAPSMKTTVVPNRNMILIALAGAVAESVGGDEVWYAAHAGDHPIYPDCRPEFALAAGLALFLGTVKGIRMEAPFVRLTKTDIARRAIQLHVPVELTWSCYDPQLDEHPVDDHPTDVIHCGLCGTCVERREAFREAGLTDPTEYAR